MLRAVDPSELDPSDMPTPHCPKTRIASLGIGAIVGALGAAAPRVARAYQAEITANAEAQWYAVENPWSNEELVRRRYTHSLGLSVYQIGPEARDGSEYFFRSRLRLDADFGQRDAEHDLTDGDNFVPGLEQSPIDLMYAYFEGRDLFEGWFGFRVGRQYVDDALGWWSFDGAEASLTTPVFLRIEGYAGFEQRGVVPYFGTRRFEAGGVWRGDRTGFEDGQYPDFLNETRLAPAVGVAVESAGTNWLHSRLTYRRVIDRDVVYLSMYPGLPGCGTGRVWCTLRMNRISSERVGYAVRADTPSLGGVHGRVVYDLYTKRWSQYGAGLDWYATNRLTVGADYDYLEPSFDGDSIFNWFIHSGISTLTGRGELAITTRMNVAATAGVKLFRTLGDPGQYANVNVNDQQAIANALATPIDTSKSSVLVDPLANVSGNYRWNDGSVSVGGGGEFGDRGHTAGVDSSVRQLFSGGFYDTLASLSVYDWSDALRPTRDATSVTYVLGGGISPIGSLTSAGRVGLEWEHTFNRLVGQRFRVLATLDFTVLR